MEINAHNQKLKLDLANGAAITHLSLLGQNGKLRSIIEPNEEFQFESSLLFPFPNRLEKGVYQFKGKSYQFPLNDFGLPNALHGMIHNMHFECAESTEDRVELQLVYGGDLDYYPFPFKIVIEYSLGLGSLDISVSIENIGDGEMPCGFGWHPYFNLADKISEAKLRMNDMIKVEVNENAIPTGKHTPYHAFDQLSGFEDAGLDNCFIFSPFTQERSVYLVYEDKSVLDVWQDHHQNFVQVFIHPNKKAIAIEPMTCGINALNNGQGLRVLAEGEVWDFKLGLRYT